MKDQATRHLVCPRDGSSLETRHWDGSDYAFCATCHGIRIERKPLEALVRKASEPPLSYPEGITEGTEIMEGALLCACSGQPVMDGLVHGDLSLDVCRACGAFWFDAGEIQCYLAEHRHQAPPILGDARSTFEVIGDSAAWGAIPFLGEFIAVFFD
jgi:Zn-finger nucleic acid-binding protein